MGRLAPVSLALITNWPGVTRRVRVCWF